MSAFDDGWIERSQRSVQALRARADQMRAMIMYDKHRGIVTYDDYLWTCLGWDVANMSDELAHPSEAVAKIFNVPAWRPTDDELAWFREGFASQRSARGHPTIRG